MLIECMPALQSDCYPHDIEFPSNIDMPAGRIDAVNSSITGQPLRYFTPDPLPDLLRRCQPIAPLNRHIGDKHAALLLVRAAAVNTLLRRVDLSQARRLGQRLFDASSLTSADTLIALGKNVNPKIQGLRGEVVFVGARIPSSAAHVFAPHSRLPALIDSLVSALSSPVIGSNDPLIVSAVVGFFCATAHPFVDGNGRWSRLVAASSGNAAWPSMVAVAFQNACKSELVRETWPEAKVSGLRRYLDQALLFEYGLVRSLGEHAVLDTVDCLTATLKESARSKKDFESVLCTLFCTSQLPLSELKAAYGMSMRAVTGLAKKIVTQTNGSVVVRDEHLNLRWFDQRVNEAIVAGKTLAFPSKGK